jgi:hypothetical protein
MAIGKVKDQIASMKSGKEALEFISDQDKVKELIVKYSEEILKSENFFKK